MLISKNSLRSKMKEDIKRNSRSFLCKLGLHKTTIKHQIVWSGHNYYWVECPKCGKEL